jgi:pimeloyl-ACP methyl ester carboxylesterase
VVQASEPGPASLLREGLGLLELPRLLLRVPELSRLPRGSGQPVMVLPGFATGDSSTLVLQTFLRLLGYQVRGWRMGLNTGRVNALLPRVVRRVVRTAELAGEPVRLVGWSLGGLLAREAARERPDSVKRVVTLGAPLAVGYRETRADPIRVPLTAIWSRADAIVPWQASVDLHSPDVENVEVGATHLGLGFSADVYRVIAERIARP